MLVVDFDELYAASGSRAVCRVELARAPSSRGVARRISVAIFDVLDECAQFGQNLTFPGIVQKNPWCGDGKGRQECLQLAFSDRRFGERTGQLRKAQSLECCSKECGVVVRNERPRDDCLDRLAAVEKGPRRNGPVRAAQA